MCANVVALHLTDVLMCIEIEWVAIVGHLRVAIIALSGPKQFALHLPSCNWCAISEYWRPRYSAVTITLGR